MRSAGGGGGGGGQHPSLLPVAPGAGTWHLAKMPPRIWRSAALSALPLSHQVVPCCAKVGLTMAADRPGVLLQIIMIRALYSYVRVLPAYRLHRVAKVSTHQQLWLQTFNVSTGSCPDIVSGIAHKEPPVIVSAMTQCVLLLLGHP